MLGYFTAVMPYQSTHCSWSSVIVHMISERYIFTGRPFSMWIRISPTQTLGSSSQINIIFISAGKQIEAAHLVLLHVRRP